MQPAPMRWGMALRAFPRPASPSAASLPLGVSCAPHVGPGGVALAGWRGCSVVGYRGPACWMCGLWGLAFTVPALPFLPRPTGRAPGFRWVRWAFHASSKDASFSMADLPALCLLVRFNGRVVQAGCDRWLGKIAVMERDRFTCAPLGQMDV
jgi:hypothetical protein